MISQEQQTANTQDDANRLADAVVSFNQLSVTLAETYQELDQNMQAVQDKMSEQENQLLQEIINGLPAGLIVLNNQGEITLANQAAQQLCESSLIGQAWLEVIQQSFQPQSDDGHEVSLKNGKRIKLDTTSLISVPGQAILLTDLTQTRQLQNQLSQQERLSAMGRMLASLAHQIRTPLASAMLYTSNIENPEINLEQAKRFGSKALKKLHDLEQKINDMLIFAKGGNSIVDSISTDELMQKVSDEVQILLEQTQSKLAVNNLVNHRISCNVEAMVNALHNLIDNAIDAQGPEQQIIINIFQKNQYIGISVTDAGPGIAPQMIKQVLQPFVTTKAHGTGLGLAVVEAAAKAHQGFVEVENKQNNGLTVSIYIRSVEHDA